MAETFKLSRQQLASFLPNPEAIRAFEALFSAVHETIPANAEQIDLASSTAQQQAGEALAALAAVASELAAALLAPLQQNFAEDCYIPQNFEKTDSDNYVTNLEVYQQDSYGPQVDFSNILQDLYVPPNDYNNYYDPQNVAIKGGSIDGTAVGATSAASGSFTTLNSYGDSILAGGNFKAIYVAGATRYATAYGSNGGAVTFGSSAGNVNISPAGLATAVFQSVALQVNFFAFSPSISGNRIGVTASGSDTNIGIDYVAKGTGAHVFNGNGAAQVIINGTSGATRQVTMTGSNGGNPAIGASGGADLAISSPLNLSQTTLLKTSVALANGAAAAAGTLLNAPVAGNPTKWIPINDNGTTRYIPAW